MSEASGAARRSHSGWVKALVITASVLTVVAIFSAWVQRQALDTGEWVNTSNKLLDKSEIRDALANYAVDQLYANVDVAKELKGILPTDIKGIAGPAASGLRGVAVQGAGEVIGTTRFQDAWEQANTVAHSALIKVVEDKGRFVGTGEGNVTLRLRPLILQVADEVGLGSDVASKIPADVGNIKVLSSNELGLAQTIVKLVNGIALATTILVLVLFGLAIYLPAGYRWITVLSVGVGLILAGTLVLILREVAGNVVVDQLAAPDVQPAAEQAWGVSTSLLQSISSSTIYYGAFFMIAAWLASPARSAFAVRRFIAPVLKEYPAVGRGGSRPDRPDLGRLGGRQRPPTPAAPRPRGDGGGRGRRPAPAGDRGDPRRDAREPARARPGGRLLAVEQARPADPGEPEAPPPAPPPRPRIESWSASSDSPTSTSAACSPTRR